MGDGANDLPMILASGIGIAFHAKPVVREQAPYQINTPNLALALDIIKEVKGDLWDKQKSHATQQKPKLH